MATELLVMPSPFHNIFRNQETTPAFQGISKDELHSETLPLGLELVWSSTRKHS
jgi:hypothetical protein